jgi:hypothetical protein
MGRNKRKGSSVNKTRQNEDSQTRSAQKHEPKQPNKLPVRKRVDFMFVIISGFVVAIILAAAGMLYSHDDKRIAIWVFFVGGVLTLFIICKVWSDAVTVPDALDKPSPTPFKSSATSTNAPTPGTTLDMDLPPLALTASPAVSSPADEGERITPEMIRVKVSEAEKEGRDKEIRAAFVGIHVDWNLFLWSANIVDEKHVRAFFTSMDKRTSVRSSFLPTLVTCTLSKDGNERLPLVDREVEFRVEGTIEEVTTITTITLKDVRLTRINRSTPPTSPTHPDSTNQANTSSTRAITSLRDLESLTFDQILERLWDARTSDRRARIAQAIVGMRVDWTLTLQSVSPYNDDRFWVFLTAGRDSEGQDRPEDKYHCGLVAFFVPKQGNERLPLLEEYKQRIRVRGKIKAARDGNVNLDDAEFELV